MKSKILRSMATLVLLLAAGTPAGAAVLYTFSSGSSTSPTSDFSFVVDEIMTANTTVGASCLFDVVTYIQQATLGPVGFSDLQTSPVIFLTYPDNGLALIYVEWSGPFTQLGSYTHLRSGATLRISSVPEPGALTLLGLGLAGLWLTRRRNAAEHESTSRNGR